MSISDAEFKAWLAADNRVRAVLIEAVAYSGGVEVTRYLSNVPFVSRPSDTPANIAYEDALLAVPAFNGRLNELFTGFTLPSYGDAEIINESGVRDSWLDDAWDGRALTMLVGDPSWPRNDFRTVLVGVCADIYAKDRATLALKLRDKSWMLNVPAQAALMGGSTANADQPKPIAVGECFNVEPVLEDAATHKYRVHDGAVEDITAVRDNGVAVAFTKDVADGSFVLSATPAGRITADVKGAKPGGTYHTKVADIVQYLVTTHSQLTASDIDAANFTAFNVTCPQPVHDYVRGRDNLITMLDRIVSSVGGFWTFSRTGLLRLGRLEAPAGTPVVELLEDDVVEDGIEVASRAIPVDTLRLGYKRNFTQQPDGLAGAVTETDRAAYAAEYLVATASNAGITTTHKLASNPDLVPSQLTAAVDADAEATRRATLKGSIRKTFRVNCYMLPLSANLGEVVKLTHPRFGFAAGALAVLVGITERVTQNRCQLELWR